MPLQEKQSVYWEGTRSTLALICHWLFDLSRKFCPCAVSLTRLSYRACLNTKAFSLKRYELLYNFHLWTFHCWLMILYCTVYVYQFNNEKFILCGFMLMYLSIITKTKVTAVLELRTCGSVDWSCTDYKSEIVLWIFVI